jgi:hypothetical protein
MIRNNFPSASSFLRKAILRESSLWFNTSAEILALQDPFAKYVMYTPKLMTSLARQALALQSAITIAKSLHRRIVLPYFGVFRRRKLPRSHFSLTLLIYSSLLIFFLSSPLLLFPSCLLCSSQTPARPFHYYFDYDLLSHRVPDHVPSTYATELLAKLDETVPGSNAGKKSEKKVRTHSSFLFFSSLLFSSLPILPIHR